MTTLFRRSQMNSEMEDELRAHIQNRADDLERTVRRVLHVDPVNLLRKQ